MEINSLKEIDKQDILNLFYPVGSYYETSNENFDPNIKWGGTWEQDTVGLSTIAADIIGDSQLEKLNNRVAIGLGDIRGELNHQLTTDELAKHYHPHRIVAQTWAQINR